MSKGATALCKHRAVGSIPTGSTNFGDTMVKDRVFWSDKDNKWVAIAANMPGAYAKGDTPEEARKELKVVKDHWMTTKATEFNFNDNP